MKTGKLSESVVKRSILKKLRTKRPEVIQGAGIGEDCALFSFGEEVIALSVSSFTVFDDTPILPRIIAAVNNVAAGGARPTGILIAAILPPQTGEQTIKSLMDQVEAACGQLHIQAVGGDSRISPFVTRIQLSVTILGKKENKNIPSQSNKPGQDVVMTKWLGLAGTALLARKKKDILLRRLPAYMIDEATGFDQYMSVIGEAATAVKFGTSHMHDVSRGGIFTALWELAQRAGVGLNIDIKKLPIKQETVEICEILGVNPYELDGAGSLLMICEDGNGLVDRLRQEGILAVVIGKITDDNARILINGEEKRYLDRPAGEALEEDFEGADVRNVSSAGSI